MQNCRGIYYDPVCTELGFSLGAFTLQGVFGGICAALAMPLIVKLLFCKHSRAIMIGALVIFDAGLAAMSLLGRQLWTWYIVATIQSVAGSFLTLLPVPLILGRWFYKRRGVAIATAATFSGVMSIFATFATGRLIAAVGWRSSYLLMAAASFLLTAPTTFFVLRNDPAQMGLRPYGVKEEESPPPLPTEAAGAHRGMDARIRRIFILAVLMNAILAWCTNFTTHLPKFGISIGMTLAASATLSSCAMLGNTALKPAIGMLSDRFGVRFSSFLMYAGIALSFACLLLCQRREAFIYIGATLCGISMSTSTVQMPLLIAEVFRGYDYERYYSYVTMATGIAGTFAASLIGFLYDGTGSYRVSFICGLCFSLLNVLLLFIVFRIRGQKAATAG